MKRIAIDAAPADPVIAFGDGFPAGFFRHQLEMKFEESFVVADFEYKKTVLDYAVIVKDRLIEVAHVRSKEEYVAELSTIARAGRISLDKHKQIRAGKFITNAFYFLSPVRILVASEIPPKYGLITYNAAGDIAIRQEADWIKPDMYLTKNFYCTLCKNLTKQLYK